MTAPLDPQIQAYAASLDNVAPVTLSEVMHGRATRAVTTQRTVRLRWATIGVVAASLLATCIVIGLSGVSGVKPKPRPGPLPAAAPPATWSSLAGAGGDFWLLGTYRCAKLTCPAIARSTDGGSSFVRVGAPSIALNFNSPGDYGFGPLQFANAKDGYVTITDIPNSGKGADIVYRTDNGGKTWQRVDLGGQLTSGVVTTPSRAYALVSTCPGGIGVGGCTSLAIASSSTSDNSWATTPLPVGTRSPTTTLAAFGSRVWLAVVPNGGGNLRVFVSSDQGKHFSSLPVTDTAGLRCQLTATSVTTLWGFCATGMEGYAVRSVDGGRSFAGIAAPANPSNSAVILPLSNTVAVYGVPLSPDLWVTRDAGRHFTAELRSASPGGGFLVAFASTSDWLVLQSVSGHESLRRTMDGGRSWEPVPLPLGHGVVTSK